MPPFHTCSYTSQKQKETYAWLTAFLCYLTLHSLGKFYLLSSFLSFPICALLCRSMFLNNNCHSIHITSPSTMFWHVTQPLSKVSRAFRNTQSLRLYLTVELWIASTAITSRLQRDSQSCDIPLDPQQEMVENIVTALRWENETYPRTWNHLQNDSLDLKRSG